jgi:hypothetical protein
VVPSGLFSERAMKMKLQKQKAGVIAGLRIEK